MAGTYQGLGPITREAIHEQQWLIVQKQIAKNRRKAERQRGYRSDTTTQQRKESLQ